MIQGRVNPRRGQSLSGRVRLRFAPSPTGYLHIGNARTVILNALFARKHGGSLLLRIDDSDQERCRSEFTDAILEDLRWLGIEWDESVAQSERVARYHHHAERLKEQGRLYPCFETQEELALGRKIALAGGRPPLYDRAALKLGEADIQGKLESGLRPHWRFRLDERAVEWHDLVQGVVCFDCARLSDPVLIRADGVPLYSFSSVVDDGELGITHIVRGRDHVSNTAAQIQIFEALGMAVPGFAHFPLLKAGSGDNALSKRDDSLSLRQLRADGIESSSLLAYLALLGTSHSATGSETRARLIEEFDVTAFGRADCRFDLLSLWRVNETVVQNLPWSSVAELEFRWRPRTLWTLVRPNLKRVDEVKSWLDLADHGANFGEAMGLWWRDHGDNIDSAVEALRHAVETLPESFDSGGARAWIGSIGEVSGRRGRALYLLLRVALSGRRDGPELSALLSFIERPLIEARLRQALEVIKETMKQHKNEALGQEEPLANP